MRRHDAIWRHIFAAVLGPPPSGRGPGSEVARLCYARRCFVRMFLAPTLVICVACVLWAPVVELPFAFCLLVVWVLFVVRINARIRQARAAQPRDPQAGTSSAANGVRS